jgi:hypothetical protein
MTSLQFPVICVNNLPFCLQNKAHYALKTYWVEEEDANSHCEAQSHKHHVQFPSETSDALVKALERHIIEPALHLRDLFHCRGDI